MNGKDIKRIRHTRILEIRKKIQQGNNMGELLSYCIDKLKVSRATAKSYIDEAAAPYRKKYQESL